MFVLEFKTELCFDVFLNAHSEDVSVDRQLHLLSDTVKLGLLLLNHDSHLVKSSLKLIFDQFARIHLFDQTFLVDSSLRLHCLIVSLEVSEHFVKLLLLSVAGLQGFLDSK
jgi:hypothetical protein